MSYSRKTVSAHSRKIAVIGLGYVGLPVAVAFSHQSHTIGFDIKEERIRLLKKNCDVTQSIMSEELESADLLLTSNPNDLKEANFFIIAVPTPVDLAKHLI